MSCQSEQEYAQSNCQKDRVFCFHIKYAVESQQSDYISQRSYLSY